MNTIPDLPQATPRAARPRWQKGLSIAVVVTLIVAALAMQFQAVKRRLPFGNPQLKPMRFVQITGRAETLVFSPDGKTLMVSGGGRSNFIQTSTGRVLRSWDGGGYDARWSSDGRRVMERNFDYKEMLTKVILRDAGSGRVLHQWTVPVGSSFSDVSRDLTRFITYDYTSKTFHVCDAATGRVLATAPFSYASRFNVRFSRNGRWVSVPKADGASQVLRTDNLRPAFPQIHFPPLAYLVVARDGQRIVGLDGKNATLHFWQLPSGAHSTQSTGFVSADWLYTLQNGNLVLQAQQQEKQEKSRTTTSVIQVRSADGSRVLHEASGRPDAFSSEGQVIGIPGVQRDIRGFSDGTTHFYDISDLATGTPIGRLDVATDPLGQTYKTFGASNLKLAIAPLGRGFAVGDTAGMVRFYDASNATGLRSTGAISTAEGRIAPEGAQVLGTSSAPQVSTTRDGTVTTMGADADEVPLSGVTMKSGGTEFDVQYQSASPDGRKSVWFCQPKPPVQNAKPKPNRATRRLAMIRPRIEVRDSTGRVLNTLQILGDPNNLMSGGTFNKPSWSPDGSLFAVSDQVGRVFWWNIRSGQLLGQLSGARAHFKDGRRGGPMIMLMFNSAARLAFSPDNRHLAAGRNDGSIYLYDLQTRLPVAQIGKAANQLHKLAFSTNGRTVYGIPLNGKDVLAWDAPKLQQ